MTDNEIIKALECCLESDCHNCPYDYFTCDQHLIPNALDLINRAKANEIKYRRKVQNQRIIINALSRKINRQNAEIERLKEENKILSQNADTAFQDGLNEAQDLYAKQIKNEIKAEAIKEFAERLKPKLWCGDDRLDFCIQYNIDNLVKEMAGGNNGHN